MSKKTHSYSISEAGIEPDCPHCHRTATAIKVERHECPSLKLSHQSPRSLSLFLTGSCPLCHAQPGLRPYVSETDEQTVVPPRRGRRLTVQALEDSVTQEIAELKDKLAQLQGIIIEATNKLKHLRAEIVSLSRMKADASEVAQLHDEIQLLARLLTEQASGRSAPVPKEQTLERAHRAPALSPISLSSSRREPFTPVDVAPRSYSYLPPQQGFLTPPVVLEECLPELPLPWVKVAQDYRSGDFQESDEGKLILVKDGSLGGEERFVLPSQARFQQAQTYSRYASCYECQRPAGGKVRLLRLAVARRVAPQAWQVTIKGELEIM